MIVNHIYHSGYMVELENNILIFDWYKGKLPEIAGDKRITVFISHRHGDHYGRCAVKLSREYPDVRYFIDSGISRISGIDATYVEPHREYESDGMKVTTLLSTDEGVAFLVETEGMKIYHAGDLNLWYWNGEPEEDNRWQYETYRSEIDRLSEILGDGSLDIGMVTFDPRQENHIADGINYFNSKIKCENVFIMHYWDDLKGVKDSIGLIEYRDNLKLDTPCIL